MVKENEVIISDFKVLGKSEVSFDKKLREINKLEFIGIEKETSYLDKLILSIKNRYGKIWWLSHKADEESYKTFLNEVEKHVLRVYNAPKYDRKHVKAIASLTYKASSEYLDNFSTIVKEDIEHSYKFDNDADSKLNSSIIDFNLKWSDKKLQQKEMKSKSSKNLVESANYQGLINEREDVDLVISEAFVLMKENTRLERILREEIALNKDKMLEDFNDEDIDQTKLERGKTGDNFGLHNKANIARAKKLKKEEQKEIKYQDGLNNDKVIGDKKLKKLELKDQKYQGEIDRKVISDKKIKKLELKDQKYQNKITLEKVDRKVISDKKLKKLENKFEIKNIDKRTEDEIDKLINEIF